jgi:hypothetical protein
VPATLYRVQAALPDLCVHPRLPVIKASHTLKPSGCLAPLRLSSGLKQLLASASSLLLRGLLFLQGLGSLACSHGSVHLPWSPEPCHGSTVCWALNHAHLGAKEPPQLQGVSPGGHSEEEMVPEPWGLFSAMVIAEWHAGV